MAVIKRSDAEQFARQAVALHLGDLNREGDSLVARARQQAEAIIAEAKAERERLIGDAAEVGHAEGHAKGHAEGLEQGREQGFSEALTASAKTISETHDAWAAALEAFEQDRARMIAEAKRDIVRLAAVFAERVVRRAVELDETVVERQLERIVEAVVRPSRLLIAVHPDDVERARGVLPGVLDRLDDAVHAEVSADASLRRGSCVARLAGGAVIDASIDTQVARLVEVLLPGGEAPTVNSDDGSRDDDGEAPDGEPTA